jgi:hypothetical protein
MAHPHDQDCPAVSVYRPDICIWRSRNLTEPFPGPGVRCRSAPGREPRVEEMLQVQEPRRTDSRVHSYDLVCQTRKSETPNF